VGPKLVSSERRNRALVEVSRLIQSAVAQKLESAACRALVPAGHDDHLGPRALSIFCAVVSVSTLN